LPLSGWYPPEVPPPTEPSIIIDSNSKNDEEIVRRAVFHTYNIVEDDVKLRFDPSRFEKVREQYPVRREFQAFTVKLKGDPDQAGKILEDLGFRVEA